MLFQEGDNVRIPNNCDHPASGLVGTITRIFKSGNKQMATVRLDHGYKVSSLGLVETRYSTVISVEYLLLYKETFGRTFTKKVCSICGKPCYSNRPGAPTISQDFGDNAVICSACTSHYRYDRLEGKFVPY